MVWVVWFARFCSIDIHAAAICSCYSAAAAAAATAAAAAATLDRRAAACRCLPGVEVGDIGPKFGYNGVDNGFLRFDHVTIPRTMMLMKFARVDADGTYVPPPADNAKASYSTMLFVRADIVKNASWYLAKATTITTRYCAVRRQTASKPGVPELQVRMQKRPTAKNQKRCVWNAAYCFAGLMVPFLACFDSLVNCAVRVRA